MSDLYTQLLRELTSIILERRKFLPKFVALVRSEVEKRGGPSELLKRHNSKGLRPWLDFQIYWLSRRAMAALARTGAVPKELAERIRLSQRLARRFRSCSVDILECMLEKRQPPAALRRKIRSLVARMNELNLAPLGKDGFASRSAGQNPEKTRKRKEDEIMRKVLIAICKEREVPARFMDQLCRSFVESGLSHLFYERHTSAN